MHHTKGRNFLSDITANGWRLSSRIKLPADNQRSESVLGRALIAAVLRLTLDSRVTVEQEPFSKGFDNLLVGTVFQRGWISVTLQFVQRQMQCVQTNGRACHVVCTMRMFHRNRKDTANQCHLERPHFAS